MTTLTVSSKSSPIRKVSKDIEARNEIAPNAKATMWGLLALCHNIARVMSATTGTTKARTGQ
jgi:hypothetical protein